MRWRRIMHLHAAAHELPPDHPAPDAGETATKRPVYTVSRITRAAPAAKKIQPLQALISIEKFHAEPRSVDTVHMYSNVPLAYPW